MNQLYTIASPAAQRTTALQPMPCTTCMFHLLYAVAGGTLHLCTLPPDCAPPLGDEDVDHWRDREERMSAYVGTSCDLMRRMDAICGPRGRLWSLADGR